MTGRAIRVLELRSVRGTGGGPDKTILLGAQRADPDRCEVTVCYMRDASDPGFGIDMRVNGLDIDYVEIVERGSFDPRIFPALRRLVRTRGIDIVHSHEYKSDLLTLLLARTDGTIAVATSHGWTGHSLRERCVYYPIDKRILRAFPMTIAVSSEIRAELLKAGGHPERVQVILNGIDHRAFRRDRAQEAAARRALGVSAGDIVVGAIGRLEPQKRFDLLIRACASLRKQWPRLRLFIAGHGSLRDELERMAAEQLPDGGCQLLGHRVDVSWLHHGFDLFVQSSDYEGTPNAVLEAMALETPLIATGAGGTAEILEHEREGILVPCGDVRALGAAIERTLMAGSAAAERVARARRRVETSLSFDARAAALDRVYSDLVSRFRRPTGRQEQEDYA